MTTYTRSARQRLVGSSLREYRESAGYDLGDAARILDCDRSKISRIETGQRSIRSKELRELLAEYGADAAVEEALVALARPRLDVTGWWTEYASALPVSYLELVAAEMVASAVIVYAPVQVPELLQVPAYACAAAAADASVPEEYEAIAAAAVSARQRVTLRERSVPVDVVIGEAVLRQQYGDASAMRAQLTHLAELAGRCRYVTIRLLPFDAGLPSAGGAGGFTVLRFGPVPTLGLVHVAGPDGGLCPDTLTAAIGYLRAFSHLHAFALSPERTADELLRLASRR
jgi:transcriptional regulator with XRE-family HTH domain